MENKQQKSKEENNGKVFIFYVLLCQDDSFYAGYTVHLERRVIAHNAGKGAKYTKSRRPVRVIYSESYETKQEAMKAEYAFKQLTRKEKESFIRERRSGNERSE